MHSSIRRRPIVSALIASAIVCGALLAPAGSPADETLPAQTPEQILAASRTALGAVHSFRMDANVRANGSRASLRIDVVLPGRVRTHSTATGGLVSDSILIGKHGYLRGNRATWRADKSTRPLASKLAERWLRVPPSTLGLDAFIKATSPTTIGRCMIGSEEAHGTLANAGVGQVDGTPAVIITDQGDKPGTTPMTLYIATSGPPLLLRIVQTGPMSAGGTADPVCGSGAAGSAGSAGSTRIDITYSRYEMPIAIAAPQHAVDPSTFDRPTSGAKSSPPKGSPGSD